MKTLIPMCLAVAGLLMACSSHPKARESVSRAPSNATPPPNATVKAAPADAGKASPVIGFLAGRNDVITIKAGPHGPLYSVTTKDGRVLHQDLSAEQLQARAPEIYRVINGSIANDARLSLPEVKMQVIDHDRLEKTPSP